MRPTKIGEYIEGVPGGYLVISAGKFIGTIIGLVIGGLLGYAYGFSRLDIVLEIVKKMNQGILSNELGNEQINIVRNTSSGIVILALFFLLIVGALLYVNYMYNADKIYIRTIEKSDSSLPFKELTTTRGDANQLKVQKSRTSDFLSKLDERFINKEISDQNYKDLKAKYETQLKVIEKEIVETELHE